jgi:hypothetical protein
MEWQPIETAPKDEEIIVGRGAIPLSNRRAFFPAYSGSGFWCEEEGAWVFWSHITPGAKTRYDQPTHWMPLPPPPTSAETPQR